MFWKGVQISLLIILNIAFGNLHQYLSHKYFSLTSETDIALELQGLHYSRLKANFGLLYIELENKIEFILSSDRYRPR